jgi:hypothetical protein
MTTVLIVADRPAGEPVVGPDVAERLATLGISRITLLRDPSSTAVVLEGWAFDPARTNEATGALFPTGGANLRTYHEVQYVGVFSAYQERDAQWHTPSGDSESPSSRV